MSKEDILEDWITEQFTTINDSLTLFKMQITNIQKVVKNVEKDVRKELKSFRKDKKNEKDKAKRAPSGFAKPTKVTKELCMFLDKPEGSEIARTEVTKALVNYIKEHNLIELDNKIVPDEKLKTLLGVEDEQLNDLTYFTIQKHMNKHFYSKKDAELTS
jgi:chromatin remodeling complex protein RSC6